MEWRDLGVLEDKLLLFGGPYSNLQALDALFAEGATRGISDAHMICTGDVVAYGARAAECVAMIRDRAVATVAGNVERQLAAGAGDCGCGFAPGTVCDRLSAGWYAHADAKIDDSDRGWMAALPDGITFEQAGKRVAVIHGGATDIARFIWSASPQSVFEEELSEISRSLGHVDIVIAGHSGIAFERRVAGVDWINAGVIGMPPHNGGASTQFVLLQDGAATVHALHYDAAGASQDMRQAGLTQGYDAALLSGYWPSEDVLPDVLRKGASASG